MESGNGDSVWWECSTWGTRFQGGDMWRWIRDVRVREVRAPASQPMHNLVGGAQMLLSSGQMGVAFPILLTRHLQTLSCPLQHAGASQLHPKLGPKLGPALSGCPRSQPLLCLSGTSDSQGLGSITSPHVGPLPGLHLGV